MHGKMIDGLKPKPVVVAQRGREAICFSTTILGEVVGQKQMVPGKAFEDIQDTIYSLIELARG